MTVKADLLPCPFCGGAVKAEPFGTYGEVSIACKNFGVCAVRPSVGLRLRFAVAAWNSRMVAK